MAIPFYVPNNQTDDTNNQQFDQLLIDLYNILYQILLQRRPHDEMIHTPSSNNSPRSSIHQQFGLDNTTNTNSTLTLPHFAHHHSCTCCPREVDENLLFTVSNEQVGRQIPPNYVHKPSTLDQVLTEDVITLDDAIIPTRLTNSQRSRLISEMCIDSFEQIIHKKRKSYRNEDYVQGSEGVQRRQDWIQIGVNLRKIADLFQLQEKNKSTCAKVVIQQYGDQASTRESFFSAFFPVPKFSGSMWTAVVLVAGWCVFTKAR